MSFYRKYRPQTFEDVVGQEHVAQTLRNALGSEPMRISHAYLFCGPRGTGKTTTARLLAKCLNCEQGPTSTPCNQCDFCTGVSRNATLMDLIEIDAASNTGVDNVRENIIDKVNVAPAQGRYRVYIIDEVHMLSTSSFNALLKTLEEPPPHAVFVLATTDAHKLPTTVTSRCQRYDFRRIGPRDIANRIKWVAEQENIAIEDNAALLIALTADGALRDALTLLEQVAAFSPSEISEADVRLVLGTVSRELLEEIVGAVAANDAVRVLQAINGAVEEGASFAQLTRDLTHYMRDLLLMTVGYEEAGVLSGEEMQQRHHFAEVMGRARLMNCVEALRAADKEMRQSTDHRLLLELTLVRAASNEFEAVGSTQSTQAAPNLAAPSLTAPVRPQPPKPMPQPVWRQPDAVPSEVQPHQNGTSSHSPVEPDEPNESTPMPEEAVPVAEIAATEMVEIETESTQAPEEIAAPEEKPAAKSKKRGRRIHNLAEFVELWPAVLVRVKKKIGITAVAYLHDAYPVKLNEDEAVLEFKKEFHYAKACEAAERLPFEEVLNGTMDAPRRLRFQLAEPVAKPEPKVEEEPSTSADDDDEEDDILSVAKDMFGAEVVGRSGRG